MAQILQRFQFGGIGGDFALDTAGLVQLAGGLGQLGVLGQTLVGGDMGAAGEGEGLDVPYIAVADRPGGPVQQAPHPGFHLGVGPLDLIVLPVRGLLGKYVGRRKSLLRYF